METQLPANPVLPSFQDFIRQVQAKSRPTYSFPDFFPIINNCHPQKIKTQSQKLPFKVCVKQNWIGKAVKSESQPVLYYCDLCSFVTKYGYYLTRHKRIHTNEKPYRCPTCGKSFKSKCYVKIHMRIHNSEKVCHCDFCDYTCCDRSNMKKHLRTHTGEKPFTCHLCHRSFAQSGSLARHLRTHDINS